jgi:ribosomal protein S18 acetylase RimI-like enzyme
LKVSIRKATLADVDGIARVHVQAWRESYRELMPQAALDGLSVERRAAQWRGTLSDPHSPTTVYVAVRGGTVCGFGSGGKVRWTGLATDGEISALYLLDAVKRQGVGRRLFRRLIRRLAAQGFKSAGLWVLAGNAPGRSFYEAMGGRSGETRIERRGELVLDEIAYLWNDLAAAGTSRRSRRA